MCCRYVESATEAGIVPLSCSYFYSHWPANIKDAAKVRECICGTCFHCGSKTISGFRMLIEKIQLQFVGVPELEKALEYIEPPAAARVCPG